MLRLRQTKRHWRHATEGNTNIFNHAAAKAAQRGNAYFRNGLSIASSHLSRIVKIPRKPSSEADGSNQLIGRQLHLLVIRVEAEVRHPALAANRHQNQFSLLDQQSRQ